MPSPPSMLDGNAEIIVDLVVLAVVHDTAMVSVCFYVPYNINSTKLYAVNIRFSNGFIKVYIIMNKKIKSQHSFYFFITIVMILN
jgi:hypothetical protein